MQNNQYISIMTPAASSGTVTFTLQTLDASTNVTIVAAVTGVTTSLTEITFAQAVKSQLTTLTVSASYTGNPSSIADGPQATFRFNNTDHVVEVFSEARFNLTVTANTTGAIVKIGDIPSLITVSQARNLSTLTDQPLEDVNGTAYTDAQVADIIELLSAKIITILNNPIVATTYRFEQVTNWQRGIELDHYPVLSVDPPNVFYPAFFNFLSTIEGATSRDLYFFEEDGWVNFRYNQEILDACEPFDYGNMFRMTYVAGYGKIPTIIKLSLVELVTNELQTGEVLDLKGGTFAVKLTGNKDLISEKLTLLRKYQN